MKHTVLYKAKKKKLLCCPLPTDRKMRKNRVGFFLIFFMSDLGEEFAKMCIQWLKKALAWLVYAFWLHSARVFPI